MNSKHLIFILSLMTVSFNVIIGIMLAFNDTNSQSPVFKNQKSSSRNKPIIAKKRQNEQNQKLISPYNEPNILRTPKSNQISGNKKIPPSTLNEFSSLKKELGQQIRSLQNDRSVMIADLAKILGELQPNEIAKELSSFDEKTIDFILRQYDPDLREAIQIEITGQK